MAEFVHYRLERSLVELEAMERFGLFNKREIKLVVKKRKDLEYRFQRRTKTKDDYLKFIKYEMNVLALIKQRRQQLNVTAGKDELDSSIGHRISRLFKSGCFRFQSDIKLWLSHIEFCQKMNWKDTVSRLYTSMLQKNSQKPDLWVKAAKWEFEQNDNADTARKLLLRALRFHPENKRLNHEYFRMELMYAECVQKRLSLLDNSEMVDAHPQQDNVLQGKLANIVFQNAVDKIPDVEFVVGFLDIAKEFNFTEDIITCIKKTLTEKFATAEESWNARAIDILNQSFKLGNGKGENEAFELYEHAVSQICTEKMWSFYIGACKLVMENSTADESSTLHAYKRLSGVLQRASGMGLLAKEFYSEWIHLVQLTDDRSQLPEILSQATISFSSDGELWRKRIEYQIALWDEGCSTALVDELIEKAIECVSEEQALAIWQLGFSWHSSKNSEKDTENFLERALVRSNSKVIGYVKSYYLEFSSLKYGLEKTRQLYERLWILPPITKAMFKTMVDIESSHNKPSLNHMRIVFDHVCRNFGATDVDIWVEFYRMELQHPKSEPTFASRIYSRAMRTLQPELTDDFIAKITIFAMDVKASTEIES